jgi:squalene-hopene/tetraprenyl-beta-curcumene cyclase
MGEQGLYYCYHTMAKALSAYGAKTLKLENGKEVDWRKELALKLMNLQKPEGFWVNENARWWEKDPVLVTAYATITLEMLHRGL